MLCQSSIFGRYWRNDDNFKLHKGICGAEGGQMFKAMNTMMNEFGEIVARYLKPDASHASIIEPLKLLARRMERLGEVSGLGLSPH